MSKAIIYNNDNKEYITKSELSERWSGSLIKKYFPKCSMEKTNPHYKRASPMQLYEINKVKRIEATDAFKADLQKAIRRKIVAHKTAEQKREKLVEHINGIHINIPTIEKDKLIQRACGHYNNWNEWKILEYNNYEKATPSSDEAFLKRITTNYLRHQCTRYDKELEKLYKKVGKYEAHDVLKERINEAIKEKYEWLKE